MNIKDYVANNNLWRSSMTPLDSDYVTWEKSAGGIRPCVNREAIIDGINASGGSNSPVAAKITSGDSVNGFTVTLYADGVDNEPTGYASNIKALDMAISNYGGTSSVLDYTSILGSYVYLFPMNINITASE